MQLTINEQYNNKLEEQVQKFFHSLNGKIHSNHFGPKIFTELQKLMIVILYRRSGQSYRRFTSMFYESRWPKWLGLKEIPSKSSVHSWFMQLPKQLLRKLNSFLLRNEKPLIAAIDSTGIDSWQRSRHYERILGDSHMPYAKLSIIVDVCAKFIHDHAIRMVPRHDVIVAEQLFKRQKHNFTVLGDKGYDSEPLHELARANGLELKAPVRSSSKKRPKGRYRRLCAKGIEEYSRRKVVESSIHRLKAVYAPFLRSKLHWMKKKEISLSIFIYNLELMIKSCFIILRELFWTHLNQLFFLNAEKRSQFTHYCRCNKYFNNACDKDYQNCNYYQ
jgi:hypothetical protein